MQLHRHANDQQCTYTVMQNKHECAYTVMHSDSAVCVCRRVLCESAASHLGPRSIPSQKWPAAWHWPAGSGERQQNKYATLLKTMSTNRPST